MDQALLSLYHEHVAVAFDRQLRFADFLEREAASEPYHFTTSKASLEFGNALRFVAYDLGSHATPDNSWLWVWCNPNLKLTPANKELADKIRKFGEERGIAAFTAERQISCDEHLGPDVSPDAAHVFAAIVAGEFGFDAYYTMPFANGRFATVIPDERLRDDMPNVVARILSTFPRVISAFPVPDQRAAFIAYAKHYRLSVEEKLQTVRVLVNGEEKLKAKFDRKHRLTTLTGTVGPMRDL
jgi:hypothetical protein